MKNSTFIFLPVQKHQVMCVYVFSRLRKSHTIGKANKQYILMYL